MPLRQKISKWCMRGLLGLLLCYAIFLGAVYFLLERDPGFLANRLLQPLAAEAGLTLRIGAIDVSLMPAPALTLSDVSISGGGLQITAAWAQARPTLKSLVDGDFFPGFISLLRPRISYNAGAQGYADLLANLEKLAEGGGQPALPGSLRLEVIGGEARLAAADADIRIAGIGADLRLAENGDLNGSLNWASAHLLQNGEAAANLEKFAVAGHANVRSFRAESSDLSMSGILNWRNVVKKAAFSFVIIDTAEGLTGSGQAEGNFCLDDAEAPFDIFAHSIVLTGDHTLALRGLDWRLDKDLGSLRCVLTLPQRLRDFRIVGALNARRLSLTQWFGFARNLAPGLQHSLNRITNAFMRFELTSGAIKAWDIKAECAGAVFSGTGGVADFNKPVVALELVSPDVVLHKGVPEAIGKTPDPPQFAHAPLTPMPGEPLKPGEIGIDYDIRLAARLLRYGPLRLNNAALRIHPGKLDKNGLQDVLLDGKAGFYGGSVSGACIIGGGAGPPYHITAKADKVNAAPLSRHLRSLPARQGQLRAAATVTSRGKSLAAFLANLRGKVEAQGQNVALPGMGSKNIFPEMAAAAELRGGHWDGHTLTMDARWEASLRDAGIRGNCELNGKMGFGDAGMSFRHLPGSITASLPHLPSLGKIRITGKFGGSTARNSFEMADGLISLPGLPIHLDASIDAARATATGHLRCETRNPAAFLRHMGLDALKLPALLLPVRIEADYTAEEDKLKLSKLAANLGKHRITGYVDGNTSGKTPEFSGDLTLDRLHLPDFINASNGGEPNWDFPFMSKFDAAGKIRILEMSGWNFRMSNVRANLRLVSGQAEARDVSGAFYGAPLSGGARADFRHGLALESRFKVNAFDLGKAVADQKADVIITGSASMAGEASARLGRHGRMAPALNGKWSFSVKNGSFQATGKKSGSKITRFHHTSASGGIEHGIVKSGDFRLQGDGLEVTGGGSLNLVSRNIDCAFQVNMKGIPDFPLYIYGPVAKPKTSIGAGKMILNAVGGITTGFVDAIGGVLRGAWGIFTK